MINSLKSLELALGRTLKYENIDEFKQTTENFINSVSKDISAFNRLIHSFEDKLSGIFRTLEEVKKIKPFPLKFVTDTSKIDENVKEKLENFENKLKSEFMVFCMQNLIILV